MTGHVQIDLVDILLGVEPMDWTCIYEDGYFRRRTACLILEPGLKLRVIADGLPNSPLECFHMSLLTDEDDVVEFRFAGTAAAEHAQGRLLADNGAGRMLWMPVDPVLRTYDAHGRVISATASPIEAVPGASGWGFRARAKAGHKLQFALLVFDADGAAFHDELTALGPQERRLVVRNTWFRYEGPADVWRHFVDGIFLHRPSPRQIGFQSQNIACTVYFHLSYLASQTGKRIYRMLADMIAYAVMLSLPSDARWRHGVWTDRMETHTVHQVSGIHVLLDAFERTHKDVFLGKAQAAADYLISIADHMHGNGIWFLHDTLECDIETARLYYGGLRPSRAFGKSPSNTLTFNSHIATLIALHHLQRIVPRQDYAACIRDGLAALRTVLQADRANSLYSFIYGLRDRLVRRSVEAPKGLAARLTTRYDEMLRRRWLPRFKRRWPRLAMPDGYVERDLGFASLSDFYHLINMEDMLGLYRCCRAEWLAAMIRKSVDFTLRTRLAEYMGPAGFGTETALGVLFLYAALIDESVLTHLVHCIRLFREASAPWPVKIFSSPTIADPSSTWSTDNADLMVLTPADQGRFSAVVMNPTPDVQTGRLTGSPDLGAWRFLDSYNQVTPAGESVRIPPGGYLRIVKT